MKKFTILILIILISFVYSTNCGDEDVKPSGSKDCEKLSLDLYKSQNYTHCCYLYYKYTYPNGTKEDIKYCTPMKQKDYDNIKEYIETTNSEFDKEKDKDSKEDIDIKSIDCISYYLQLTLLNIILFVLFFIN